jgi:hypothetical protein
MKRKRRDRDRDREFGIGNRVRDRESGGIGSRIYELKNARSARVFFIAARPKPIPIPIPIPNPITDPDPAAVNPFKGVTLSVSVMSVMGGNLAISDGA